MTRYNPNWCLIFFVALSVHACGPQQKEGEGEEAQAIRPDALIVEVESFVASSAPFEIVDDNGRQYVEVTEAGWLVFDIEVPVAGRYQTQLTVAGRPEGGTIFFVEDHYGNKDDRHYNITGNVPVAVSETFQEVSRDGSPMNAGPHKIRLHFDGAMKIDRLEFRLLKQHQTTPNTLTQNTTGSEWTLAWSDEFDGPVLDTSKWTYDIGDWGWGNYELQYYTADRTENTRIEDGNLIIEARKNDLGSPWTSARITTRGKVSFLYGKIEFRAKVPSGRGNWAAGWTLGDDYVDELSWPYCGEIDIMESVGYEMEDSTGDGIAHASAHSPAYYFKLGNQPTSVVPVKNMNNEYHTYAVEWTPHGIKAFVDDQHYFTYEDTSSELTWPFNKPQNIILNLAMGGGWGGYEGMDESMTSQKMVIDYVRVYELK